MEKKYQMVKEEYAKIGVDTDAVLRKIDQIKISIHCWQGDDIGGFLFENKELSGGIAVTGDFFGKASTPQELRNDLSVALSLIPGRHKINLHAIYGETDEEIEINEIDSKHFSNWVEWAKKESVGLDFNPTLFSHSMVKNGLTLSHPDSVVRNFWIEHVKRSRKISEYFATELNQKSICNLWIPDGYKDYAYRKLPLRKNLKKSLDEIYGQKIDKDKVIDTLESKLFGLGVEGYTVGSHEFYLSYGVKNNVGVCFDTGHFHLTESVSDKLSAVNDFLDNILLHVSRPMRWDSDHVVTFGDDLNDTMAAIVRDDLFDKVYIGLDYFDASINRVAAWVVGVRNVQKALLQALLEPAIIKEYENNFDFTSRLLSVEESKTMPLGIVFDYYCYKKGVPMGKDYLDVINKYENEVLRMRGK